MASREGEPFPVPGFTSSVRELPPSVTDSTVALIPLALAQVLHHGGDIVGIGQTVADRENPRTIGDRLGLIDRPAAEKDGGSGRVSRDRQDQQQ